MKSSFIISIFVWIGLTGVSVGAEAPGKTSDSTHNKRQTSLSFEDDVVENLNNPLLDSLDSTRSRNANLDGVLYLKRIEYKREIKQNLRELRYLQ